MPYGKLSPDQVAVVRRHVAGKVVHDLGAGDLDLAHQLLDLGATEVYAVDRAFGGKRRDSRIHRILGYFHQYEAKIGVAFVSWPCNWQDKGLIDLVVRSPVVIYLGRNTDGTMCGGSDFWAALRRREVLGYHLDRTNNLIVYGPQKVERPLLGEEWAGQMLDRVVHYEELLNYPGDAYSTDMRPATTRQPTEG